VFTRRLCRGNSMIAAKLPAQKRWVMILIGSVLILVGICGVGITWLNREDPRLVYTVATTEGLYHVAFSPDGRTLATSALRGEIALRRVSDGTVDRILTGHTDSAVLAFSPDGRRLVAASRDQTIRLWNLETGKQYVIWRHSPDQPHALTFRRPYDGLVIADYEPFSSIAFSPDGSLIAAGSDMGRVLLFETESHAVIRVIQANTFPKLSDLAVNHVAISRDNRLLLSVAGEVQGMSGGIKLWSLPEGRLIRPLVKTTPEGYQYSPDWAVFNPSDPNILTFDDAKNLLNIYVDRNSGWQTIKLAYDSWSLDGHRLPAQPKMAATNPEFRAFAGDAYPTSFAVSSDARIAAWGGGISYNEYARTWLLGKTNDPRIIVWRLGDPELTTILIGHEDNVEDLAFSPDNKLLASVGAFDRTLRVWRLD
jgi:WD40 repeat protein